MKKVISNFDASTIIHASEANKDLFYGVLVQSGSNGRGFIQEGPNGQTWRVMAPNQLTMGNYWGSLSMKDLTFFQYLEFLQDRGAHVFQFPTFLELASWLNEAK